MYSVTKRIDFCYGHRLLDYDGICKHPHGHNAVAEIEVRTDRLDNRNMVCDFSDIKRIVKGWIDRELDHKMLLRHDDPMVAPLVQLGEPVYLLDSHPTGEATPSPPRSCAWGSRSICSTVTRPSSGSPN